MTVTPTMSSWGSCAGFGGSACTFTKRSVQKLLMSNEQVQTHDGLYLKDKAITARRYRPNKHTVQYLIILFRLW